MSTLYQVRHVTRYRYESEISENVMEVRQCPLTRDHQRVMSCQLKVKPRARLSRFEEYLGTVVHSFDIPQAHQELTLTTESLVEVKTPRELPQHGEFDWWQQLKKLENQTEYLDFMMFSPLVQRTPRLESLFEGMMPQESEDPLCYLQRVNRELSQILEYRAVCTQADHTIDQALEKGQGACQDFAHLLIGLGRMAGIPCRYLSGYLFHPKDSDYRSSSDATHAWMEAYLPSLGWIGFDPTNSTVVGSHHISTALGRDHKDVPPTRGVCKGFAASELSVAVQVTPAEAVHSDDDFKRMDESVYRSEPLSLTAPQAQQQ
ncbi:MAG: transglutaminase family protein [Vulcanimicrobiota bacterium]